MSVMRCENACSKKADCFAVRQWYTCKHYQCFATHVTVHHCIMCGVHTLRMPNSEVFRSDMVELMVGLNNARLANDAELAATNAELAKLT